MTTIESSWSLQSPHQRKRGRIFTKFGVTIEKRGRMGTATFVLVIEWWPLVHKNKLHFKFSPDANAAAGNESLYGMQTILESHDISRKTSLYSAKRLKWEGRYFLMRVLLWKLPTQREVGSIYYRRSTINDRSSKEISWRFRELFKHPGRRIPIFLYTYVWGENKRSSRFYMRK